MMRTAAPTFGIEEEFVLLDPLALSTVDVAVDAVAALGPRHPGRVGHEFFASQVEHSSPVFDAMQDARAELSRIRADLAEWASDHGVVAAGSGTPFRTGADGALHAAPRYVQIARDIAGLAPEHQINGMHVGVANDADAVRASDALRPWLPVLLALSSNSPSWQGRDTGFSSWRSLHGRRWTTHGIPPRFGSATAHVRARAALAGVGATSDAGTVNGNVRVSAAHPTPETRVYDSQLDVASTQGLAAIVRALVGSARVTAPRERAPGLWDAALWHAARYGLSADLIDPPTGRLAPAQLAVVSLRRHIARALDEAGDTDPVDAVIETILRSGTGAAAQRRARRHGVGALAELYRGRLAPGGLHADGAEASDSAHSRAAR